MTATNGERPTAGERHAAARAAYLASTRAGRPLTGAALGAQFGRSRSWGAARIAETRHDTTSQPPATNSDNHTVPGTATPVPDTANRMPDRSRAAPGTATARGPRSTGHDGAGPTGGAWRVTSLAVVAVMLVAAATSYDHQRELATLAGEGWRSYLLPISVDGLVAAASATMLTRRHAGRTAGALASLALTLGLAASLAANIVAADPALVDPAVIRRVVAAWPPIALALTWELFMQQLHPPHHP